MEAIKVAETRRSTRRTIYQVPLTPPETPERSKKRKREIVAQADHDDSPAAPSSDQQPSLLPSTPESKKKKKSSSVYVRKWAVDKYVVRMDSKLASLEVRSKVATVVATTDHETLLHGPLFSDPASGVQPANAQCKWTRLFTPLASPLGLIQETLFYDPWRLLASTIFLNKTRGSQARPILFEFLKRFETPEKCVNKANVEELAALMKPLGLQNRRARSLVLFSAAYLENFEGIKRLVERRFVKGVARREKGEGEDEERESFELTDLPGELSCWLDRTRPARADASIDANITLSALFNKAIGKYGSDSFYLFCHPDAWKSIAVEDKELKKYVAWRRKEGKARHVKK